MRSQVIWLINDSYQINLTNSSLRGGGELLGVVQVKLTQLSYWLCLGSRFMKTHGFSPWYSYGI